ncbi:peptidase C15 [Microcoleus sp. FACHB-SPT15]|uniref:pyroglutamyl-peptidase I family protein n=1 Tax=Microcoleus sp. FACHB-SPT15 TaxID=2692830 RepID=UPI00177B1918|nr:peptidase C15 [Microcoleus sp. FACHB-SPT15]MBD1806370.1 peptidase C15 [Microcoleus sp. FACHB-SPT15]
MNGKILLTSFQTWLPHQRSNASDDLLEEIAQLNSLSPSLTLLRQLPVDVPQSSRIVIDKIEELQPDVIICCGMAECRTKLTVESCATCNNDLLKTSVSLEKLVAELASTEISHDAGKFVCEGLYYEVLSYLRCRRRCYRTSHNLNTCCIFVHVPVLTPENLPAIVADFRLIIEKVADFASQNSTKS